MYKLLMAISIILLIAGFSFGVAASFYSSRLSFNENLLKTVKTSPASLPQMNSELKDRIAFLQWSFLVLVVSACMILLVSLGRRFNIEKVTNKTFVVLLMFLLLLCLPMVQATPNIGDRWYATLYLMQPRNSLGVRGCIFYYTNTLDPNYQNSFVAFRLMLVRIDLVYYNQEWLEIGYFQNQSGYWIYSASYILGQGYTVNDAHHLDAPSGDHSFVFEIKQALNQPPNTFEAKRELIQQDGTYPPVYEILKTVTFTINSDNYYHAASETNDNLNSLTAYYTDLKFYDNGWQAWTNVSPTYDSPYMVQLGSTDKFYTYKVSSGLNAKGHISGGNGGGYIATLDYKDM